MRRLLLLIPFLALLSYAAPATVQRKNGTSTPLTITSTAASHTYYAVTSSTTSPASLQTTGGTGDTFTKIGSCVTPPGDSNIKCYWLVKSSHASGTAMTCTTCGTINYMFFWEISGTDTTNPLADFTACTAAAVGPCLQTSQGGTITPKLILNTGFNAEWVAADFECSGSDTGITATGVTLTENGTPNGNVGADGVLASATTITAVPIASCGGFTNSGAIVGIKGSGATITGNGGNGVFNFGYFDYGAMTTTSGNATVSAQIANVGDLIVVYAWCKSTCTITSVTVGSQTATQTSVSGSSNSTHGAPFLYYILSSTQSGAVTITMNISGTYTNAQVAYAEYTYTASTTASHDVDSTAGTGTGTAVNTPSLTPSAAGELLLFFSAVDQHVTAVNSPLSCNDFVGTGETGDCSFVSTRNAFGIILSGASGATANNMSETASGDTWQALATSFKLAGPSTKTCTISLLGAGPC